MHDDRLSVRSPAGARPPCGACHVARGDHGSHEERAARRLRSLDRRAYLAHPRRHRGQSEEAAPGDHRARRRLCVCQVARLRWPRMRRLYQKIYLTIIAALLLVVVIAGALWRLSSATSPFAQALEMAGQLAGASLPSVDAPQAAQQQALDRLAKRVNADLTLFDSDLRPLAFTGRPLPPPSRVGEGGWIHGPGGPAWSFRLPDLRWVVVRAPMRHRNPAIGLVLFLGLIAFAVAVCAFPVVRGLTRRLERLQAGVETLGAGNLSTRVKVEGRDEVARLAESFNRAAGRIEELVAAHRMLLANASHELRTPLSRIRLGIELMGAKPDPKYAADLKRDIAELDGLIDEILLASKLEPVGRLQTCEEVDLLAYAAEE